MPSFDVVSKVDMAEVDNAINGVKRETQQRFDLKGTKAGAERADGVLTVTADSEMQLRQMHELLHTYFARRDVDSRALEFKTPEKATGSSLRQQVTIRQGLDADLGRKIVKASRARSCGCKSRFRATNCAYQVRNATTYRKPSPSSKRWKSSSPSSTSTSASNGGGPPVAPAKAGASHPLGLEGVALAPTPR